MIVYQRETGFAGFLSLTVSAVAVFPPSVLVPQALNGKVAHEQIAPFFGLPTVVFCVFVWKMSDLFPLNAALKKENPPKASDFCV